jgi:hypothetical protein
MGVSGWPTGENVLPDGPDQIPSIRPLPSLSARFFHDRDVLAYHSSSTASTFNFDPKIQNFLAIFQKVHFESKFSKVR